MSVAIVAALPREIAGLVKRAELDRTLKSSGIHLYRLPGAVVVAAGMGSARVTLAVEAAMKTSNVDLLVSVGLAGACGPATQPGSVVDASEVIDARSGERFRTNEQNNNRILVSSEQIASAREKARLRETYGAAMVDMEAATVARLARANGVEFRAVKGISDAHDFEIESLAQFADAKGQFQTMRFALHTAVRPHRWSAAATLGRESSKALRLLTETLLALINTQSGGSVA